MNLALPAELQQFTQQQLATGKYASLDAMLIAGLEALAERESLYQGRFDELRHEVLLGAIEAKQGHLLDAPTEVDAIRQRLRNKYS